MKSIDIGTAFLVKGELDPATNETIFTRERNCFLQAAETDDTEETLKENNWSYVKHNDKFYIVGEDAIKLKNLLTIKSKPEDANIIITQVGELRRPMKDGLLNTGEEKLSVAIIQQIIKNLVGPPAYPNECLCFCSPGDPVDKNLSVVFHKTMLTNFLKSLGYAVECIPEALAIIYSERPVADDPEEGEMPFSGIGISFGGGMCNVCLGWKQMPLINFSIARSGDFIDKESAKVAGIDISAMTRFKETKLDLANIDLSDMRQAALQIFYQNMVEHALNNFAEKFNQLDSPIDVPLEIVIAGGTASVPGFIAIFEEVLYGLELPFKVKSIKMTENPLYVVANGCLVKSIASERKNKKESINTPELSTEDIKKEDEKKDKTSRKMKIQ